MSRSVLYIVFSAVSVLFAACGSGGDTNVENLEAKKMMQGTWLDSDTQFPVMKAEGDTIYYADSTLVPAKFKIVGDSLILFMGDKRVGYYIFQQSENILKFKSQNEDTVKLVKSTGEEEAMEIESSQPVAINQGERIKRDTIVFVSGEKIRSYVNISPTSYKVYITTVSPDGVDASTVYYDNIVNLTVYSGAKRLFSRDFKKQDFAKYVPEDFIDNSILSDIIVVKASPKTVDYQACLAVPDGDVSYRVDMSLTPKGELIIKKKQ